MQPTIEEKEAVLKMAGYKLISTPLLGKAGWVAIPPNQQPLTSSTISRKHCIDKAFEKLTRPK